MVLPTCSQDGVGQSQDAAARHFAGEKDGRRDDS